MVDIQGTKYPDSDGLTEADPAMFKDYTEWADGLAPGQLGNIGDFMSRKFYSCFDYTGAQNVFAIPQI